MQFPVFRRSKSVQSPNSSLDKSKRCSALQACVLAGNMDEEDALYALLCQLLLHQHSCTRPHNSLMGSTESHSHHAALDHKWCSTPSCPYHPAPAAERANALPELEPTWLRNMSGIMYHTYHVCPSLGHHWVIVGFHRYILFSIRMFGSRLHFNKRDLEHSNK